MKTSNAFEILSDGVDEFNEIDIETVTSEVLGTNDLKNNFVDTSQVVTIYDLFCADCEVVTDEENSGGTNDHLKEGQIDRIVKIWRKECKGKE